MFKSKILSLLILCLFFLGCKKNASGGKASISGVVNFNGNPVTQGTVYIKYGATSPPLQATDPTQYDSQVNVDATGAFTIASLYPGDYYLYFIGHYTYPNQGYETVTGGTHANIPHTKSTVNYDIATAK